MVCKSRNANPREATAVHRNSDEDVKDSPTFKELAPKIIDMIKDSDLGGFNSNRFDIPLLAEELLRAGYDFDLSKHRPIDAQTIFHKMEPRNLSAAYSILLRKISRKCHSAEADTLATFEVLDAQIEKYADLPNDIAALANFHSIINLQIWQDLSPLMIKMKKFSLLENTKVKK